MDELIKFTGSEGRYQLIIMILLFGIAFGAAGSVFSPSFFLADPNFTCKDSVTGNISTCDESKFCQIYKQNDRPQELIKFHYNSWVKKYGLICEKSGHRDFYKQLITYVSSP